MTATLSAQLAHRPDLLRQFRNLDDALVVTLARGGETGPIRREYDALTRQAMREIGTAQRPTGADFAQASLLSSARTLKEGLDAARVAPAATEEASPETIAPARRVRMRV